MTQQTGENVAPRYVVRKATRPYVGGLGYLGPSWGAAGLRMPTVPFWTRQEAQDAADALSAVNVVGFIVAEYSEGDGRDG